MAKKLSKQSDTRLAGLKILLKEVLEQIDPDRAEELVKGYLDGKDIVMVIRQSSHGKHCKTAFTTALGDHVTLESKQTQTGGGYEN